MLTVELAKTLIRERLNTKPTASGWMNEFKNRGNDAYFGDIKRISLLPAPCGYHHRPVYSNGINVNTLRINHYDQDRCLFLDNDYVAVSISMCCGAAFDDQPEANDHIGEIVITFDKPIKRGDGTVEFNDYGLDLTLDELEQRDPEFLKNLVFNLK